MAATTMGHSNVPSKARDNLDRVDGLAAAFKLTSIRPCSNRSSTEGWASFRSSSKTQPQWRFRHRVCSRRWRRRPAPTRSHSAEVAPQPAASRFAIAASLSEPMASQAHIGASRSGPVTLRFDLERSQPGRPKSLPRPGRPTSPAHPERPVSQPPSGPPWP